MSGQKQHINYTLADIEKYLQGELSPAEMHALEKAALQDPFLADAIEGYQQSDIPLAHQHLAEIREKLLKEDTAVRPIAAFRKPIAWMRIAAIFILLIGAGAVGLYFLNNADTKQETAQLQQRVEAPALPNAETAYKDTLQKADLNNIAANRTNQKNNGDIIGHLPEQINQDKEIAVQKNLLAKAAKETANKEVLSQLADEKATQSLMAANVTKTGQLSNLSAKTINGSTLSAPSAGEKLAYSNLAALNNLTVTGNIKLPETKDIVADKAMDLSTARLPDVSVTVANQPIRLRGAGNNITNNTKLHTFTGRVTDSAGKPIVNASVSINNTNKGVATDANGNFTFLASDSLSKVEIAALGFESREQQLTPKSKNEFTLKPSDNALSEVVVIGYGTKQKKVFTGAASKIDAKKTQLEEVSPPNGWDEFKKQLTVKVMEARSKNFSGALSGTIEAELNLTRRGKATSAIILSSFNASLNETFIQAIKDVQRWQLANGKPGRGKKKIKIAL